MASEIDRSSISMRIGFTLRVRGTELWQSRKRIVVDFVIFFSSSMVDERADRDQPVPWLARMKFTLYHTPFPVPLSFSSYPVLSLIFLSLSISLPFL